MIQALSTSHARGIQAAIPGTWIYRWNAREKKEGKEEKRSLSLVRVAEVYQVHAPARRSPRPPFPQWTARPVEPAYGTGKTIVSLCALS